MGLEGGNVRKQIGDFHLDMNETFFELKFSGGHFHDNDNPIKMHKENIDDLEYLVSVVKKEFERLNGGRV